MWFTTSFFIGKKDPFFYHSDHMGYTGLMTERHVAAVQHLQYLPYGERHIDQRMSGHHERFALNGEEKGL